MLRLIAAAVVLLASPVVRAEVVRVAVSHATKITVEGEHLVLRGGGSEPFEVSGKVVLEAVGPFVSTGDRMDARFSIEEATGGAIRIDGVSIIGGGEVAAGKGGLVGIDVIDLERYVASVVGMEMPSAWPEAALEAQSIAARTYVLSRKAKVKADQPYDVESGVRSQAYGGAASIDARSVAAAEATRGQVLSADGALAETFFFASCSGKTESAKAAFGGGPAYLKPVSCETAAGAFPWTHRVALSRLSATLKAKGSIGANLEGLVVETRTASGRLATVRLKTESGSRVISAAELRQLVGSSVLPSLDARIEKKGADLVFTGHGAGHGVGLCQWGARAMAARGVAATDILDHYYPTTQLTTWQAVRDSRNP